MKPPPDTADITLCRRCECYVRIVTLVNGNRLAVNFSDTGTRVIAYYDEQQGRYTRGWFVAKGSIVLDFVPGSRSFDPHGDTCRPKRAGGG